ncbi:DUF1566 domain-containing protein [Rheinheimera maricola]|uniref:DUF1566 domain-containing protein n=1 Tax=Rheinheimera maricola TaxID=2793282 RepID=A0ABS7XA80_9GAMM|nr:DUF1566 domain-containing protein [Rheinheimera maricola]MBZ9611985.1 DUF1566 domain-containing protein [Rheinheimera maricola]
MKKLLILSALVLTACSPAPTVVLRIDCGEYNNKDLQVTINNEVAGTCPLDTMIRHGETVISARKDSEDASYLYSEVTERLAENAMKRIKLEFKTVYPEPYYFIKATDISGINRYLAEFPEGKNAPKLLEKLENIYYENAKDVAGIDNYLTKFPEGKYATELREQLESIFFLKASDIKGAQAYLSRYPTGKNAAEINRKLAQLVEERRVADEKNRAAAREKIRKEMLAAGFIDNFDGTVTQVSTGLRWMRCGVGQNWTGSSCSGRLASYSWYSAQKLGDDGWRLPTARELFTLVHCSTKELSSYSRDVGDGMPAIKHGCSGKYKKPTISILAFPNTPADSYWTSTMSTGGSLYCSEFALIIRFDNGSIDTHCRKTGNHVRLVRNDNSKT